LSPEWLGDVVVVAVAVVVVVVIDDDVVEAGSVLVVVPPVEPAGFEVATKSAAKSAAGKTTPRIARDRTCTPSSVK
jgi:hypothetical protein